LNKSQIYSIFSLYHYWGFNLPGFFSVNNTIAGLTVLTVLTFLTVLQAIQNASAEGDLSYSFTAGAFTFMGDFEIAVGEDSGENSTAEMAGLNFP